MRRIIDYVRFRLAVIKTNKKVKQLEKNVQNYLERRENYKDYYENKKEEKRYE